MSAGTQPRQKTDPVAGGIPLGRYRWSTPGTRRDALSLSGRPSQWQAEPAQAKG